MYKKLIAITFVIAAPADAMERPSEIRINPLIERRMIEGLEGIIEAGQGLDWRKHGALKICSHLRTEFCSGANAVIGRSDYSSIMDIVEQLRLVVMQDSVFAAGLARLRLLTEEHKKVFTERLRQRGVKLISRWLSEHSGFRQPHYGGQIDTLGRDRLWLNANGHLSSENDSKCLKAGTIMLYYIQQILSDHGGMLSDS